MISTDEYPEKKNEVRGNILSLINQKDEEDSNEGKQVKNPC